MADAAAEKGHLNSRQGLSILIPVFLPHVFRAAADGVFTLEGLRVLEEPGTQLLPLGTSPSCRAALWLRALTAPARGGRAFLENRRYGLALVTRANTLCPFLPAELTKLNLQSHVDSSSLPPVKGRTSPTTAVLADPRGSTQTLQMLQHEKSEAQLMAEIAVWLSILFLCIHGTAKSLPLALRSFIESFPEEIFLITQINIHWCGFKNFKGLDVCY